MTSEHLHNHVGEIKSMEINKTQEGSKLNIALVGRLDTVTSPQLQEVLDSSLNGITGVGNFSNTDLQKALSGKQTNVYLTIGDMTDELSGNSTVKDLETMFQLIYLKFTALNKDEKKFNQTMSLMETQLKNKDLMPEMALSDSLQYITTNYSWRHKPFNAEDLKQVSLDRIMEIAKERTANAAGYTFTFVGAIDEATIRPLIEQYIASLPGKKGKLSNWVNFDTHPEGQTINHFTRKMETPKANGRIYWYDTKTPYSLENSIKADMLGQVLSKIYLQKIREDASAAYSAGASGYATINGDRPFTAIVASCPMKPEMSDVALKIMNEEIVEACKTIDETTLKEIKELMLKDHATELKENGYWMQTLNLPLENLVVISDDINLPFGTVRMRPNGSSGGHNGLENISQLLESEQWTRIRVGIGNEFSRGGQIDYVLGELSTEEKEQVPALATRIIQGIKDISTIGVQRAMNTLNVKPAVPKSVKNTPETPEI